MRISSDGVQIKSIREMTPEEIDNTIETYQLQRRRERIMSYRNPNRSIYAKESGWVGDRKGLN